MRQFLGISLLFVVVFAGMFGSAFAEAGEGNLASITASEIADMMDGTLQRLEPISVLYARSQGASKSPDTPGFKILVASGCGHGQGAAEYREEIYQFANTAEPVRNIGVFDGQETRSYQPSANRGAVQSGRCVPFFLGNSINAIYKEVFGQYLPSAIRGDVEFISVGSTRLVTSKTAIVELRHEADQCKSARYLIEVDFEHDALPRSLRRQIRDSGDEEWRDTINTRVDAWQRLENGVAFPRECTTIDLTGAAPPTYTSVLEVDLPSSIQPIISAFSFPKNSVYLNMDTREQIKVSDTPGSGFGANPDPASRTLFTIAFGISLDEAETLFGQIEWR